MLLARERPDVAERIGADSALPVFPLNPAELHGRPASPRHLVRTYILENFMFSDDPAAIDDDASLLQLGIIDSMGALEIAIFLEKSFGFKVAGTEMLPENLDSVDKLVSFILRKQERI